MALVPARKTVTTSATRLDSDPTDTLSGDRVLLVAQGAGTLVIGDASVTAATGCRVPVYAGTQISLELDQAEKLYGIVASGTLDVDVLMVGA